jgi:hypothetical protein
MVGWSLATGKHPSRLGPAVPVSGNSFCQRVRESGMRTGEVFREVLVVECWREAANTSRDVGEGGKKEPMMGVEPSGGRGAHRLPSINLEHGDWWRGSGLCHLERCPGIAFLSRLGFPSIGLPNSRFPAPIPLLPYISSHFSPSPTSPRPLSFPHASLLTSLSR